MQLFKHVSRSTRRVMTGSPNINDQLFEAVRLRLKLRGEWPPPKVSAAQRLQKWREENDFDIESILEEARAAGAQPEQIARFFADSRHAQAKELLESENTVEATWVPNEDEFTCRERSLALREAQQSKWLEEHTEFVKNQEQSRAQSERDRAASATPDGTPLQQPSTPRSVPWLTPLASPSLTRSQENKARRISSQKKSKSERRAERQSSGLSTEEYIKEQIRIGQERVKHRRSQSSQEFSPVNPQSLKERGSPLQMSPSPANRISNEKIRAAPPAYEHGRLALRPKPASSTAMDSSKENSAAAELNNEMQKTAENNTTAAAPTDTTNKPKKEKAPKQPKAPKPGAPVAPLSPALIDLRVGHILRAVNHPNADTMYVSTIAMGDPKGAEHTEVDEQTGKIVRTVCSGLKAYVKLEDMQDRKIVVVANLKPANLRSIKSAAMVLAASPKPEEGADPHSPDRTVELVQPPPGSEAGDKVYFEGWPYGDGKGPEKQLNPKKKTWEMLQPGFFTTDDLVVAFDASKSEMEDKSGKGELVVEGKGKCTVASLKGAIVR